MVKTSDVNDKIRYLMGACKRVSNSYWIKKPMESFYIHPLYRKPIKLLLSTSSITGSQCYADCLSVGAHSIDHLHSHVTSRCKGEGQSTQHSL